MWEKIRVVFTIPELRQKILLTLLLLAIYRIGWQIPLPIFDQTEDGRAFSEQAAAAWATCSTRWPSSAPANSARPRSSAWGSCPTSPPRSSSSSWAASIRPWKNCRRKAKAAARKSTNTPATPPCCSAWGKAGATWRPWRLGMSSTATSCTSAGATSGLLFGWQLTAVLTMTAGTVFLMWLGEQIDEYGIGNGISLLIMAGILARMPARRLQVDRADDRRAASSWAAAGGQIGVETLLVLVVLFVGVVAGVVFITQGQRRIPTQSAKHVRGRRVFGGTRQYLPLRVNQAGVMPIIFASSLLLFPTLLFSCLAPALSRSVLGDAERLLPPRRFVHLQRAVRRPDLLLLLLLDGHHLQSQGHGRQPEELRHLHSRLSARAADGRLPGKSDGPHHLRRRGLPGRGRHHSPRWSPTGMGVDYTVASFYGGTSLLIAVSVAFDLVQKIDSHLVMRNYRGLLEKGKRLRVGIRASG